MTGLNSPYLRLFIEATGSDRDPQVSPRLTSGGEIAVRSREVKAEVFASLKRKKWPENGLVAPHLDIVFDASKKHSFRKRS